MEEIYRLIVHPNFSTIPGYIKEKVKRKKLRVAVLIELKIGQSQIPTAASGAKVTAIKEIRLQINIADDFDSSSENYFLHRSLERCKESDIVIIIFQDFCRIKFTKILKNLIGLTNPISPP
ncbi:hypothetical protein [Draconibacterium orientale]|uniref:hypothetical protein n=1 Tax=Draconibacterium orientale TaxID=1168034 RepID=UPI002ABE5CEB|nr:hypothetical protein [Draconibacterium orientale]